MSKAFLTDDIWPRLKALVKRGSRGFVAVPFFGTGGAKLLPLRAKSHLVVRCDEASVRAGLVNPHELLKLVARGVHVHACANLHAKVFVFGRRAIVGSTNVSHSSARDLVEAGLETTDAMVVSACRNFVLGLCGDSVSEDYLKALSLSYRPPRGPATTPGQRTVRIAKHSTIWAVPLRRVNYDDTDKANVRQARAMARAKVAHQPARLDEFVWEGGGWPAGAKVGDRVLTCTTVRRGSVLVDAPARVLGIRRYRAGRSARRVIVLERRPRIRAKKLQSLLKRLGDDAKMLARLSGARMLRNDRLVVALGQAWAERP